MHKHYNFCRCLSTNDAAYELLQMIETGLDDRKKWFTVFLVLAKVFDTVSIPHLIQKSNRVGIRGVPLKLLED